MEEQETSKGRFHCNTCLGTRWHTVLHEATTTDPYDYHPARDTLEVNDYRLVQCDGCRLISLQVHTTIDGQAEYDDQYPPKETRKRPKWLHELFMADFFNKSSKYKAVNELYRSIGARNYWLTVLGARSLLEHIMIEKVGDNHTFVQNMELFKDQGYVSRVQLDALKPVIEAGHATTHRGYTPTEEDVNIIMDVLENILESIYVSQKMAGKLKVPPKTPRPPKASK